jgi:ribosome biogenesis GTPase
LSKARKPAPEQAQADTLVTATHGRHALALRDDGSIWQVFTRGKKQEIAVGDRIALEQSAPGQAWLKSTQTRRNLLYRSDEHRTKVFAANLDQVILVLAPSPPLSPELVLRTWVATQAERIALILLLNKSDLLGPDDVMPARLQSLLPTPPEQRPLIIKTSIRHDPQQAHAQLQSLLADKTTLVLGQSGMGKSSLINLMVPDAQAAINEISLALNSGRHTTTHTQLHHLPAGGALIDSPGFQAFGLSHLREDTMAEIFDWMLRHREQCRFYNCKHISEPGCGVLAAQDAGIIRTEWLSFYHALQQDRRQAQRAAKS